ncbi:2Fe-2S iron-sulfur cluster-binding protein [Paraburkholderia tagetis]|uniref:2Fe-2S iron-sulfur cluster-binding protein n=1 Tax=Paraburkholderia tagetis TaxID=2913261 RepID=A0A9X1UFY4_9BURK|nr:2Fe-2S iron-sulfur cluster-binding protein [Paraburkholderia tagetis]MCG5074845.1 2Fe-2S iron-sulfur cluster-binding protein [Paraburkholderia tagetis]
MNETLVNNQNHRITLADTGQSFECGNDDVLLRSALRNNVAFPYECNVGACGNCKFELIEGEVDAKWPEAPGWTAKDRERRRYLGCQSVPRGDCTIKLRPNPHYAPIHQPKRVTGTFMSRRPVTHDIAEFRFELSDDMWFEPGQYALLTLPGVSGQRAYSMSNIVQGSHAKVLDFQVRRVPDGQGSNALFGTLAAGQQIEIDGPYGMAYLRRNVKRDILCLAGGSGLAPMISIARGVAADPGMQGVKLNFLYGGRTPRDVCGRDMLEVLENFGKHLHFDAAVSHAGDGEQWGGHTGFVHELAESMFGDRLRDMEIYFAGPPAMGQAIQKMLLARNVSFGQVHFDQFY